VNIPVRPAAPTTPTYDAAKEAIVGLTTKYEIDTNVTFATKKDVTKTSLTKADLTGASYSFTIDATNGTSFYIRAKATATAPASAAKEVTFPGVTPAIADADVEIDYEYEILTLAGYTTITAEYSKDGGKTYVPLKVEGIELKPIIPAAGGADFDLLIRAKASAAKSASATTPVTIKPRPATPSVTYNFATEEFENISGYEYTFDGTTWVGTSGLNANVAADIKDSSSVTVKFKTPEDNTNSTVANRHFASEIQTITLPKRPAAPSSPAYDVVNDVIKGVSDRMEWNITSATLNNAWTQIATGDTTIERSSLGNAAGSVYIRLKATATTPKSKVKTVTFGAAVVAPTLTIDFEAEKLSVTGSPSPAIGDLEYAKYASASTLPANVTWSALPTDGELTSLIPAVGKPSLKIAVRVAADSGKPASAPTVLTLNARPAAPTKTNVVYSYLTEKFTTLPTNTTGVEYDVDNSGTYNVLTTSIAVAAKDAAQVLKIRVKATTPAGTDGDFKSADYTLTIAAKPLAPTTPKYDAATDSITGVSNKLQWTKATPATATDWKDFTGTTAARDVFSGGSVYIRAAATASAPASQPTAAIAFPSTPNAPGVTVNFETEALNGSDFDKLEYTKYANADASELPANAKWSALPVDGKLATLIPAAGKGDIKIAVRVKAVKDGAPTPASAVTPLTIPERTPAPTKDDAVYNYEYERLETFVGAEYALGKNPDWNASVTTVASFVPISAEATAKIVNVRVKATVDSFASLPYTLTIAARPATPKLPVYAPATDSITGVSNKLQWTTTTGIGVAPDSSAVWATFDGATAARSDLFVDNTEKALWFRTAAVAGKTPASSYTATALTIPAGVDAPANTAVKINFTDETLSVDDTMEYRKAGASAWTKIANTTALNLTSLIPAAGKPDQIIEVRYKAVTGADPKPPSAVLQVTIPARTPAPNAAEVTYDYFTEKFTEYPSGAQYVIGKVVIGSNEYKDFSGSEAVAATAKAQNVDIRIKAVDNTSFVSLPYTFTIAAQPAAPKTVKWEPKKLAVTGFTAAMEYRIEGGAAEWTQTTAGQQLDQGIEIVNDSGSVTVHVRLAATPTKPASVIYTFTVPQAAA
jgi:hypothetical protein